jgi:regulator of sigma E protease
LTAFHYIFAVVLLLGPLIFIHELGHFLVAKWCGVRVLKFSLGFGPAVGFGRYRLRWKRGHTEYVVAWFPLGGFVKMLGENIDEAGDADVVANTSDTLGAKAIWQKLAIVFAGPAMNLLLPVVVFTLTLMIGFPQPAPVIGTVEVGSPAAEAGLEPGDRIVAMAGEPVEWWSEFSDVVRDRPGESVKLAVDRDGTAKTVLLEIATRSALDPFGKVKAMGWAGAGHSRLDAILGISESGVPARQAGLQSGDRVVAVDGAEVEDWAHFENAYSAAAGASVAVEVERGAADAPELLTLTVPALGDTHALGVVPASVLVAGVSPDSPALRGGLKAGDLIVSVDGTLVGSFMSFRETVRSGGGATLEIGYVREGHTGLATVTPELMPIDVGLGIEEARYLVGISAEPATLRGSVVLEQIRNPLVAIPRAIGMTVDVTKTFLEGLGKIVTGELSRKQLSGPIGIAEIAGNALERGWGTFISIAVLISINLGILNLLPIPILDGGQAVIYMAEGIKRGPLSLRTREIFQQIGFTMLVLLMGMAFWNDISRHWSKVVDWFRAGSGL